MEAVEEPPLNHASMDGMKVTVVVDKNEDNAVASTESDVCHKSNGVSDLSESANSVTAEPTIEPVDDEKSNNEITAEIEKNIPEVTEPVSSTALETDTHTDKPNEVLNEKIKECDKQEADTGENTISTNELENVYSEDAPLEESVVEVDTTLELSADRVTFETEILIESNDNEVSETVSTTNVDQDTNNLLGELGQNIELSEALCTSDVTENIENNNCSEGQEVFNKEELLDILEGNDEEQSTVVVPKSQKRKVDKMLETQLALEQLSRLKKTKSKKTRSFDKPTKVRKSDVKVKEVIKQEILEKAPEEKKDESLVKSLVQEWDDEDATENEKANKLLEESEKFLETTNELVKTQTVVSQQKEVSERISVDSIATDEAAATLNKSNDESQPQRRHGRVIKKKVIFDPDNPDTFTKTSIKSKDTIPEKEPTISKKIKVDPDALRAKSKSPQSKLHWKKPPPKNTPNKQNKRLTEVDRLFMDEGAVNMMFQVTQEAQKGNQNPKNKAEFIKKIQSSTPDTKEMKFRERKKESKCEDGDPKRILGGKQRHSLNSSVKSPSVSEDFEAHSADDSIIYRRHSSSSYSSSCMSPRRLSDVEAGGQSARNTKQVPDSQSETIKGDRPSIDVFMSKNDLGTETINRSDCLSIKEKLNSKLNLALKKRKKEINKTDKPSKQKKFTNTNESAKEIGHKLKYLSVSFDNQLAQIHIQNPGIKCDVAALNELQKALEFIETVNRISVTLLTPECMTTYSTLDLTTVLENNVEKRTNHAYEIAESIRSLVQEVARHSKLLCAGSNGECSGVGLALAALSDIVLASELSSFVITHSRGAPLVPGLSVLTSLNILPQQLLNNMIVFGRRLSASEAQQGGLVSRTLWPENFNDQLHNIVKDISSQPAQNIWLKKQILNMKKSGSESTFLSCLEKERDLFVEYWTSNEGQKILLAEHNAT